MALKPQAFGRYVLLDKVAAGGMAEVWRAKLTGEQGFSRIYAIKKILPHVAEDSDFITMFTDEALITSSLQHANIGQVLEFNKLGETFYIAMEYISGKDLKTVWSYNRQRKTIFPLELSAYVIQKMADGLDYAHRRTDNFGKDAGVVHRDVSPQNVILSWDGEVKVIDFGIAKAAEKSGRTRPGTLKGKFAYMAPEQIRGLNLDGRVDIFALGVVLYEMCTGERGFSAESEFSLLELVRNVDIKPPTIINRDIPAELERIIFKALAKDRDQRYLNASELSEDLQRFLIQRGKPPGRHDLANYLRTNFTVDFEKERARLESYKEVTLEVAKPAPAPAKAAEGEGEGFDVITSAWGPNADGAGPPSPPPQSAAEVVVGAAPAPRAHNAQTQVRPPARPVAVDTIATRTAISPPQAAPPPAAAPPAKSGAKTVGIAAAAIVGLGAIVAAGVQFLPIGASSTVVVTVVGATSAKVRFDDRPPVLAEPSVTIDKVKPGNHILVVEEPGFVTHTTNVLTTEDTKLFPVKAPLKRIPGKLSISSQPPGATIIIDGKEVDARTPAVIEVEGDAFHEVTLRLAGYKDKRKSEVKVASLAQLTLPFKLSAEKVSIKIVSSPSGANVLIDGAAVGTTPVTIERDTQTAPPLAELTKEGCQTYRTTIPVDDEKIEITLPVTLTCR